MVLCVVQIIAGYAFLRRLDDFLQVQPQLANNERDVTLFNDQVWVRGPKTLGVKILERLAS